MFKKVFNFLLISILLSSCQEVQQRFVKAVKKATDKTKEEPEIKPSAFLISCDGIGEVKLTDSYDSLVAKFGEKALSEHENNQAGKYTSIWYDDAKEVNVYWNEKHAPFKTIKYLEIAKEGSGYKTNSGLEVGLELDSIRKINGFIKIVFENFNGKNPGSITSFDVGKIPESDPCLGGELELVNMHNIDVKELAAFRKLTMVESTHRLMPRLDIALAKIRISPKN